MKTTKNMGKNELKPKVLKKFKTRNNENRICISCEEPVIPSMSKHHADWLKALDRLPVPTHTLNYQSLKKEGFPVCFPLHFDMVLECKFDKDVGNRVLYWAADPCEIGGVLKSPECSYGQYENMGVAIKNKDGSFTFRLQSPSPYISKKKVWQRHLHFVNLDKLDENGVIFTIPCFPQHNKKISTRCVHFENQSMYLDYSGFVKAKMLGIKRICAIPEEYKIFEDDLVVLHDANIIDTSNISKNEPLVIYCANKTCEAAKNLIQRLADLGYFNVYYFPDGFDGAFKK
tara:strand:- start:20149 stop:21009 length:861 start_codon:yes stop_codon:yes gene_type:complete